MSDKPASSLVPADPAAVTISSRLAERTLVERLERSSHVAIQGRTLVVGHDGYATISDAVAAAADGDIILVRPGTYHEAVEVERTISIVGSGARGDITVWWDDLAHVLTLLRPCRVTGITVRHQGIGEARATDGYDYFSSAVAVRHMGTWASIIADCDLSAYQWAGVVVSDGTSVDVEGCAVHHCREAGIDLRDTDGTCTVTIAGNDIWANGAGVWIASRRKPSPTIRDNYFHGNRIAIGSNFEFGGEIEGNRFELNEVDIRGHIGGLHT